MNPVYQKKIHLGVAERQIKWAPVWAVMRAFGKGKQKHPSELTPSKRHWRRTKLKISPRRTPNKHLG
ncbi:MAG TPA: hypothetical protein VJK03_01950 [Candidatus Nanoarchaeia archaeon]|nr:hypothetical protein [Candidatus Nanoarchaeia archaeon]